MDLLCAKGDTADASVRWLVRKRAAAVVKRRGTALDAGLWLSLLTMA